VATIQHPVTDISVTVTPIGVKFCMMEHIGHRQKVSLIGAVPPAEPPNLKYLENGVAALQVIYSLTSAQWTILKMYSMGR